MTGAPPPERPARVTEGRRFDGSAVAAVVATLVGLLALGVSAYTADLQCWIVDQTAQTREASYRAVDRCERNEAEEFNE